MRKQRKYGSQLGSGKIEKVNSKKPPKREVRLVDSSEDCNSKDDSSSTSENSNSDD